MKLFPPTVLAPPFPIGTVDLRGQVVVCHFWDFSDIHSRRSLPYLQAWADKYQTMGLVTLGIHTPMCAFAQDPAVVAATVKRLGITYPVILDSQQQLWQAFAVRQRPSMYIIDAEGYLRYAHFGASEFAQAEHLLQMLLKMRDTHLLLPPLMTPRCDLDRVGAIAYYVTPDMIWNEPQHALPEMTYTAKEVHAVLSAPAGESCRVRVLVDGVVQSDVSVSRADSYPLVTALPFGKHDLKLEMDSGVVLHALQFVSACKGLPNPAHVSS